MAKGGKTTSRHGSRNRGARHRLVKRTTNKMLDVLEEREGAPVVWRKTLGDGTKISVRSYGENEQFPRIRKAKVLAVAREVVVAGCPYLSGMYAVVNYYNANSPLVDCTVAEAEGYEPYKTECS